MTEPRESTPTSVLPKLIAVLSFSSLCPIAFVLLYKMATKTYHSTLLHICLYCSGSTLLLPALIFFFRMYQNLLVPKNILPAIPEDELSEV
ncbi:hypothetical protein TVAG_073820 [Trichomonas vaginalis G3]|uniref:Uncharacterized protein n=1 Tax=Trichomonas vaginalis (strain ATCC PRA-98 / G3) TaxID=412133 RepID=A2EEB8_TRIV3|nr:hypothetical protein TVAGG3_0797670 [Trichomonas vaginalis G3]EAY09016.1 hypothetical protein TVAG_073820 [Trichomonas vaginalis G3]KAI5496276.1 hypothetical protein TVAGG3_0797670 [Trichomonas vaginalis G3]|eukprot:XP_001321239.1 hypothetical protein [Trichomonas vaginalis G3]